jgi:hypothetical protein
MTKPTGLSRIRRRQFCRTLVAGLGLGIAPARAAQSFKMSKLTAGYTLRDREATQICAGCLYFAVPNECMIVEGTISPFGWCTYYYD